MSNLETYEGTQVRDIIIESIPWANDSDVLVFLMGPYRLLDPSYLYPNDDDYPEGVTYRFQYMVGDGRTLLQFDNFPDHPKVDRHHYDTPDGVSDDIEYTGLKAHVQKFHTEMDDRCER